MIPKIIHYCWLSNDSIPTEFKKYIEGWEKKLIGYEFVKWDFTRFPKEKTAWVAEAFDNKKYAFAADYIRLFAVYNYGGIYMDMDMELLKPFDDLLNKPYMMAYESADDPWIEAGCFGAEKGNEFIGKCLDRYEGRHFIKSDGTLDTLPLPRIMNEVAEKNNINLELYPWTFFTNKSYDTGIETPTKDSYTIHHFAGSWTSSAHRRKVKLTRMARRIIGTGNYEKIKKTIKGLFR